MRGEPDTLRPARTPLATRRCAQRAFELKVSDLTDAVTHLKIVGKSRVVAPADAGI